MSLKSLAHAALAALFLIPASGALAADAKPVRFAWCTSSTGISMAPIAAAKKFGWLEQEGIALDIIHVGSGTDCAKYVATGEVDFAAPAIEATAAMAAVGADLKIFFTIQQVSSWSIQAPAAGSIRTVKDLKGKKVGVISLSALGATIIKGLAKEAGLDPDKDISLVAVGDAQRAAYFLQQKEIDAVSIFTLAHLQIEALGTPLREVEAASIKDAPSIAMVTRGDYLKEHRQEAVKLARAYAKGLAFTFAAPRAAEKVFYEVFPKAVPDASVAAGVHRSNITLTEYHAGAPSPLNGNLPSWGYSRPEVYGAYIARLIDWGLVRGKISETDVIDNSLLPEINDFDHAEIAALAANAPTGD